VAGQIHLVRHGCSAHLWPARRITAQEFCEWIVAFNRTGIAADSFPSDELVAATRGVGVVVCSDLPRSIESAAHLAPEHSPRISSLFREAGRPLNGNWPIRLPLDVWDYISRVLWRINWISTDEPIHVARSRAREATRELVRLAEEFGEVLCVAHGTLNSLVGQELRGLGWEGPGRVLDKYWGMTVYRRP
jgi:broad specificity phosphatase PhoE